MGRTSDTREKLCRAAMELIWAGSYGTTSVEDICGSAGVRKGSFYHFFESKLDLAREGLRTAWGEHLRELDHIFSPVYPPLERLSGWCALILRQQGELAVRHGRVLGCPVHSLGAEVSTWEMHLQETIKEAIARHNLYFESALRDAAADGSIPPGPEPAVRARIVLAYCEGLMMHARILNDLNVLDAMEEGVLLIARMGVR